MRKDIIYTRILFFAALVMLGACVKEPQPEPVPGEVTEFLLDTPTITMGDQVELDVKSSTRAPQTYSYFYRDHRGNYPASHDFGMFMMKTSAPTQIHAEGYNNFYATLTRPVGNNMYTEWSIYLPDGKAYNHIPLYKGLGNVNFYSYRPYNENVTNPKSIPFDATLMEGSQSAVIDYMYAAMENLNPTSSADMVKTPNYRHAMSLINFQMMIPSGSIGRFYLNKINVSTENDGSWIPIKGTYDATTGTVTTTEYTNSVDFFYNFEFSRNIDGGTSSYPNASVILAPLIVSSTTTDRKLKVTIYMNQHESAPLASEPLILDLSKLRDGSAGTSYGLTAGYMYNMYVYVDPSLRIVNFEEPAVLPWGGETVNIKI